MEPRNNSDSTRQSDTIARERRNCFCRAKASRAAFLIDAESYFSAFKTAVARAQRSIFIVGWDLDSRTRLTLRDKPRGWRGRGILPDDLGGLLRAVVARRRNLHVYVLKWDAPLVYVLEREWIPQIEFRWRSPRRLHFRFDAETPIGASQHQKIVVIDDAIAFLGGIDVTTRRWDSPAHLVDDPRRTDPQGWPYEPFHDVQVAVDGEAARALGALVRERWRWAGGREPEGPAPVGDPWPPDLIPEFHDVDVALARTYPAFKGRPEVHEIEALYLDAIHSARRCIFIENQYFTSAAVARAIASRLGENDPPEVMVVVPRHCPGWLEQQTMDAGRTRVLRELKEADPRGRLRVFYPVARSTREVPIMVHSKVMVVDDRLVIAGSANLNNRSMGLDSECNLAIESGGNPAVESRIADLRNRLLAEHLGSSPERVSALPMEGASLASTVERLRCRERSLEPLPLDETYLLSMLPETDILDPARPVEIEVIAEQLVRTGLKSRLADTFIPGSVLLITVIVLATLWRLGAFGAANALAWHEWTSPLRHDPTVPLIVIAVYMAGAAVMFPVLALIAMTVWIFGPVSGFLYALLGSASSAAAAYAVGQILGPRGVARLPGARLNRLSRLLARRGAPAVTLIRLLPVAPFTIVNLAAGAGRIAYRDFMLGTVLGMIPGIGAITVLVIELRVLIRSPNPGYAILFVASLGAALWTLLWARRRFEY